MSDPQADEAFRKSVCTRPQGSGRVRSETDSLGDREVPVEAYWGVNVSRALENFAISGRPISVYSDLIYAYACVKQAAALANADVGVLERWKAELIERACVEIREGAAARSVHRRHHAGRRGHVDQHELQRGDRESRAGDGGLSRRATIDASIPTTM